MRINQILIALLFTIGYANGQTTMTLKEAVNYTLNGNIDIKKQNLALIQSGEKVREAQSIGKPQVNGVVQFNDNLIIPKSVIPGDVFGRPGEKIAVAFGVQYSIPISIRADQIIYNKSYKVGVEQAKAAVILTETLTEKTKQDAVYSVAMAYYQSIIVREQAKLIKANIDKVNQSLKVVESQFENKMARKIDVDQLKVLLANTTTNYENTQVNLAYTLDNLKILMGFPINEELKLNDPYDEDTKLVLTNMVSDNIQVALLEKQLELKTLDIKSIDAKYMPSVGAFATYGSNSQFGNFKDLNWNSTALVGVQVNIPIYDGKQKYHQKQQRNFELNSIKLDQELLFNSLNVQYKNAYNKYNQSIKNVTNQEANLILAQSVYESIQNNYKNGLSSLTDIINSDTSLKEAQNQYLTSLLQSRISLLDILYVNGNIEQLSN